jgi:hypothetical protein
VTLTGGAGGGTSGDGGDIILQPGGVTSGEEGSVGIGLTNPGVAATTNGEGVLHMANAATNPVGALTGGGAAFYASSGEMNVIDAAGNTTLLSPHDQKTNEWIFRSENAGLGKGLEIRVEAFIRAVQDKLGLDFVKDYAISA